MTASGIDLSRVAELIAVFGDASRRSSGYLLPGGWVVTSWHSVDGAELVKAVFETGSDSQWVARSTSTVRLGHSDIVLVKLDDPLQDVPPIAIGKLGDRALVLDAHAAGFPQWKIREMGVDGPSGKYRNLAHVPARLASGSNQREGACELIVVPPAPTPGTSPWGGMSGAPVFCNGALVGVVTDHHHLEGLGRLSAARLDLCLAALSEADASKVLPLLGLDSASQLRVVWRPPAEARLAAYRDVLRTIAPVGGLREREAELDGLTQFCAGRESYVYWQAETKAGKTALMSTFALDPPAGVTVVPFFVTARLVGQSDSAAFTDAMLDQLSALLGEQPPASTTPMARQAHLRELLVAAAAQAVKAGGQLVLLVDGLDEDTGAHTGSGLASIASMLPINNLDGLKVVVTGRPDPPLPSDVQHRTDHPLHACRKVALTPSPHAKHLMESAEEELAGLLNGPTSHVDVVGLVAASGGGLTFADILQLTSLAPYMLQRILGSVAGRTIAARTDISGESGYLFTHETLKVMAERMLGSHELGRQRTRITAWADEYASQRWPSSTPRYLLVSYQRMLATADDTDRLATLATDPERHNRMLDHTGGDHTAYTEIQAALQRLATIDPPDMSTIVRIARQREYLQGRNKNIPPELPGTWAKLGHLNRAEALARSLTDPRQQTLALTQVAHLMATSDSSRASSLMTDAETTARTIGDADGQARALVGLIPVAVTLDAARAPHRIADVELLAQTVTDPGARASVLAGLAEAVVPIDRPRALHIAVDAESSARAATDPSSLVRAMTGLVPLIAPLDTARAGRIATDAERVACGIADPRSRARALTELISAVAIIEPERTAEIIADAVRVALTITGTFPQSTVYPLLAIAIAPTEPLKAEELARHNSDSGSRTFSLARLVPVIAASDPDHAERIARSIPDEQSLAQAFTGLVRVLAPTNAERAEQIASDAEAAIQLISSANAQSQAWSALAEALSTTNTERAEVAAAQAEQVGRAITDSSSQVGLMVTLVRRVLSIDPSHARKIAERAEQIVGNISEPGPQGQALEILLPMLVPADLDRAEALVRIATTEHAQAQGWSLLAQLLAGIDFAYAVKLALNITQPHAQSLALEGLARRIRSNPEQALPLARKIAEPSRRVHALADLLPYMTGQPLLQEQVITEAASVAFAITDIESQAGALSTLVRKTAAFDLERAEQITLTITEPKARVRAMNVLSVMLAATDGVRAAAMAGSIPDPGYRSSALQSVALKVALSDLDLAEQIAHSIPAPERQALSALAGVVAKIDPARAVRISHAIADVRIRTHTLADMVPEIAAKDIQFAETIARGITEPSFRDRAMTTLAPIAARFDLGHAVQIATDINDPRSRVLAMVTLVPIAAATDRALAEWIAAQAEQGTLGIADMGAREHATAALALAVAEFDFDRAEQLAHGLATARIQAQALTSLAVWSAQNAPASAIAHRLVAEAVLLGEPWRTVLPALQPEAIRAIYDDFLNEIG